MGMYHQDRMNSVRHEDIVVDFLLHCITVSIEIAMGHARRDQFYHCRSLDHKRLSYYYLLFVMELKTQRVRFTGDGTYQSFR